jgi:phage terminase large subunit
MKLWNYLENGGKRAFALWHRRAGKDDVALSWASVAAFQRVGTYWHMLPQAAQSRKAIWDAVDGHSGLRRIDRAFPTQLRSNTRDNEMFMRFVNGSTWQVVGSDNFNSLVGSPPVGVVFSEWALADKQAWAFLRPILAENGGWAMFITTPRGPNHAKDHYEAMSRDGASFVETLRADQSGVFTPEQLESERLAYINEYGATLGKALFDQEYMCSFEAAVVGAYYASEMEAMKADGRICRIPIDKYAEVDTSWDLGMRDQTAIWFIQRVGAEVRLVDYYEASGVGLDHYAGYLRDWASKHGARYGTHYLPHDVQAQELGTGRSRLATLDSLGVGSTYVVAIHAVLDGINSVRRMLPKVWIDETRCARGLRCLTMYRSDIDEKTGAFKPRPVHDEFSHGADALRYFAAAYDDRARGKSKPGDRYRGTSRRETSWMAA